MMDDVAQTKFDELTIFNQIKLTEYLGIPLIPSSEIEDNKFYICGKLFSHMIFAKYSFKACEFLVYLPFNQKLFYSSMASDECFTSTLKWNQNFFKKVSLCMESTDSIKNTYFSINYEKKIDIVINSNKQGKNNLQLVPSEQIEDEDFECTDKKMYLELHFIVDNQDIIAFRMLLNHLIDDRPFNTLLNKLLEYDKEASDRIIKNQKKLYEKQKEIERMEKEIQQSEDNFNEYKKHSLYKLYYLNKEKNKKISELNNDLKKEKKMALKFK